MTTTDTSSPFAVEEALRLVDLAEAVVATGDLAEFAERALSAAADVTGSPAALFYVADTRFPAPRFAQQGLPPEEASVVAGLCAGWLDHMSGQPERQRFPASDLAGEVHTDLDLYPLRAGRECFGMLGLAPNERRQPSADLLARLVQLLTAAAGRLAKQAESSRQIAHLNTYLTVSSALAQSMDLRELLEIALYCCMELASAEASSVLLLDDERTSFGFYSVEGPAKPVLMAATFPADKGLAGSVLQTQQPEVINDVRSDPRFFGQVDDETGFGTKNMIAIPLTAGEEQVGVLEVLNKVDGGDFTEEELLLLVSVAEEIAFAIRNAKVFEYVASTYCLQRQGQVSCRGCERPLGSWTPCVRYREASV